MEIICSMTGKSPSTTGAGSEGALTKGPFNALPPIIRSEQRAGVLLLCGYDASCQGRPDMSARTCVSITTSAYSCPRSGAACRWPSGDRHFSSAVSTWKKCDDFQYQGRTVLASRLGYRITSRFVNTISAAFSIIRTWSAAKICSVRNAGPVGLRRWRR